MPDETTNESNAEGTETDTSVTDDNKPISLYDKTEAIVARQEAANKKTEELLARQETLHANQRLAGTTGGRVETETKEETAKEYADKVMKGEMKK